MSKEAKKLLGPGNEKETLDFKYQRESFESSILSV